MHSIQWRGVALALTAALCAAPASAADIIVSAQDGNVGRVQVRIPLKLFLHVSFDFTVGFHHCLRLN